jgi:NurA-like 5'-3' nuclease
MGLAGRMSVQQKLNEAQKIYAESIKKEKKVLKTGDKEAIRKVKSEQKVISKKIKALNILYSLILPLKIIKPPQPMYGVQLRYGVRKRVIE